MTAERFGWKGDKLPKGRGRGFAYARYRNSSSYVAVAAEVEVEPSTGVVRIPRVVSAVDSGQAVSPDGIRNQIEGGIVQSASWTLYEQVGFDNTRVTSRDWDSYPIMRFSAVPESVEVHVIDRPGQPLLGVGEASQGPAAAAIANAIAQATGARLRDLPLTPEQSEGGDGRLETDDVGSYGGQDDACFARLALWPAVVGFFGVLLSLTLAPAYGQRRKARKAQPRIVPGSTRSY